VRNTQTHKHTDTQTKLHVPYDTGFVALYNIWSKTDKAYTYSRGAQKD